MLIPPTIVHSDRLKKGWKQSPYKMTDLHWQNWFGSLATYASIEVSGLKYCQRAAEPMP